MADRTGNDLRGKVTATLPRAHLDVTEALPSTRRAVTERWHLLRRVVGLVAAFLATVTGVMFAWPAMLAVAAFGAAMAVDATFALRTGRRPSDAALVVDMTATGVAMALVSVPSAAIGAVVAYWVMVVSVLGRSTKSWWVALYGIAVGALVSFAPQTLVEPPSTDQSLVAGIVVIAVFGLSTIVMVREFVIVLRRGQVSSGRKVEIARAIAEASTALVAEDDARALARACEAVRRALNASVVFVERNIDDPDRGLCAIVVERAVHDQVVHRSLERHALVPWSSLPGARAHLEGGAPFLFRVEESVGTRSDRNGVGGLQVEVDVPITQDGAWAGVVGAGDKNGSRVWDTEDLVVLKTLADLVAAFWQRADDSRVRDSLIGSLDGRLRYEEALLRASRALLGESAIDIAPALDAVGLASRVDSITVTRTTAGEAGSPVAHVVASWAREGERPQHQVDERFAYRVMPGAQEAIQRGGVARNVEGGVRVLTVGIETNEGWFGAVMFHAETRDDPWSQRLVAFARTIAEILGAYFERAENRSRIEESLQSKQQLIATVSHELRTPLTAVGGIAEELLLAAEDMSAAERTEMLSIIADASTEMADLIEDLLVAARSESQALSVFPESIDLVELAHSVRAHLTLDDDVSIRIGSSSCLAFGDPVRVRQVIRNLLTNAIRYGGPSITVSCGEDAGRAWIDVHDDGAGVPDADRERIFEPYGRSAAGNSNKASIGLGLALSRRLADLMGGSLAYVDGEGCTFRLMLPVEGEPC